MSTTDSDQADKIRSLFPSVCTSGLTFFDGPGGAQVPRCVAEAVGDAMCMPISNRGVMTESEKVAGKIVAEYRSAVADLVDCDERAVIYGRSWTQLTYDFSRALSKTWSAGDEVIVSRLDHDSNIRPWIQAAESVGAIIKWIDFDRATSEISLDTVASLLSDKTVLIAITGASNILGTRPNIKAIAELVHNNKLNNHRAKVYCDGVHLTPHTLISFRDLGVDFYGFSFYKMFGPHCSACVSNHENLAALNNDKIRPSSLEIPERFELGTLPYELMNGCIACVNFIASLSKILSKDDEASENAGTDMEYESLTRREKICLSMKVLEDYEQKLFQYLETRLKSIPGIRLYGHALIRTPTVFFDFEGVESSEVYSSLASNRINVPAHNFGAVEAALFLGLHESGALRIGLAPYNTYAEIDNFIIVLTDILNATASGGKSGK